VGCHRRLLPVFLLTTHFPRRSFLPFSAIFCTLQKPISPVFRQIQTLSAEHLGVAMHAGQFTFAAGRSAPQPASEEEVQRQLDLAPGKRLADLSEHRRADVVIWQTEVRMIQKVEKLCAKLQGFGLAVKLDCAWASLTPTLPHFLSI
jgi:hypothetical protein